MKFPKEETLAKRANDRLKKKINDYFPVGVYVVVTDGIGRRAYGKIAHASWCHTNTLIIEYRNSGKIHHKHFHDVELD